MQNLKHKQQQYEDMCKKAKEDAKIAGAALGRAITESEMEDIIKNFMSVEMAALARRREDEELKKWEEEDMRKQRGGKEKGSHHRDNSLGGDFLRTHHLLPTEPRKQNMPAWLANMPSMSSTPQKIYKISPDT